MRCVIAMTVFTFFSIPIYAAETATPEISPDVAKATSLVRELGSPEFRVRDAAAKELRKLGRHAKPALLEGAKSTDAEVLNRCVAMLPEVLALDLQVRIEAYLADAEGKQKHDLPMLTSFQKLVGKDAGARKLYASIVKSNAEMLEACEDHPNSAIDQYNARAKQMQDYLSPRRARLRTPIDAADIAALFLIGADIGQSKGLGKTANSMSNVIWQQTFQAALRNGDEAPAYRRLFFAWAEHCNDVNAISQMLAIMQNVNNKEGLNFAIKVTNNKDLPIWNRAQALTCVGKLGGKEHVPFFEGMFADKTQVVNMQWNNIDITTQMNDVALAMAIQVSGETPKDYGFDALQTQPAPHLELSIPRVQHRRKTRCRVQEIFRLDRRSEKEIDFKTRLTLKKGRACT